MDFANLVDLLTDSNLNRARSIRFVVVSASISAIGFPFATTFCTPTAIGYVQLPGIVMFSVMACCTVVCFFLCPPRPLFWKVTALALSANGLFWMLSAAADYWLHLIYRV